jgi:hypothetical protein
VVFWRCGRVAANGSSTLKRYLSTLPAGKGALWCYLLWYLGAAALHFEPSPAIWLNAFGIGALVGMTSVLSVGGSLDRWQIARLFLMPFCVSSFTSLVKGHGFLRIFPATAAEFILPAGLRAIFPLAVFAAGRAAMRRYRVS